MDTHPTLLPLLVCAGPPPPFPVRFSRADAADHVLDTVGFQEILIKWILNFFSSILPPDCCPWYSSQEPAWSGSDCWSVSIPSMGPGYPSSNPQS